MALWNQASPETDSLSHSYVHCKAHQKRWRSLCVDIELRDEWLVRMNNVSDLQVTLTCSGHKPQERPKIGIIPHYHPGASNNAKADKILDLKTALRNVFSGNQIYFCLSDNGVMWVEISASKTRGEMDSMEFEAWWEKILAIMEKLRQPSS